ncbi:MAG: hypothetical protein KDI32_00105 [Pseudomonadales bacterium]|nr:hypothetical protein [Pseudomonadales bacterium]
MYKSFTRTAALVVLATGFLAAANVGAAVPTAPGWYALPNTKLRSVCAAEHGFPQVEGAVGCRGITYAWSGGAFDSRRNRLIIFGGGHNDYYGNEIYAVNIGNASVQRLTDPGLPIATSCVESIAGGTQPNSRHTYDGVEYIASVDKLFVFGGSLACAGGYHGGDTWTFDFGTMRWQNMQPSGPQPQKEVGILTAYDPNTGLVFLHDRRFLFSYNPSTNAYTQLTTQNAYLGYHMAATIDPVRKKFVIVGYNSGQGRGSVYSYDITPGGSYAYSEVSTSGATGAVGAYYPGLAFDPTTNKIVAWTENQPNTVYSLDIGTRQWTSVSFSGGPAPTGNGTHGRWQYSAASGVFVLANKVDDDVMVFRAGSAPPPDTIPPGQVQGVRLQ